MPEELKGKKSKMARRARLRFQKSRDAKKLAAIAKFHILHAKGRYWDDEAGTVDLHYWEK